jgi:sirohydrochlorin cobaltochelatase
MNHATILFAHGARSADWAKPFQELRDRVAKALPNQRVELAYLELMEPSLTTVIDRLAGGGTSALRVVPVFLGSGAHVRRDLPELVANARERWPSVVIALEPPLGERAEVLEALAQAAASPAVTPPA